MSSETTAVESATTLEMSPSKTGIMIPASDRGIVTRTMGEAIEFAQAVVASGLAPKHFNTAAKVLVAMQYGAEIGLSKMQSLTNIAVINGRACLWGDALPALVLASGKCKQIAETFEGTEGTDSYTAVCTVHRVGNKTPFVGRFSVKDAKVAGTWTKDIWKAYPARMLQMRARAFALRDGFADVLCGMGVAEEVSDYAQCVLDLAASANVEQAVAAATAPVNGQATGEVVDAEIVTDPTEDKDSLFSRACQLHDELNPGPELWAALLAECDVPMNSEHVRKISLADVDQLKRLILRLETLKAKTAATSDRMDSAPQREPNKEGETVFQ